MKIEDIVCNFEHAEKIRKLGVKVKGVFAYGDNPSTLGQSNTWPFDYDIPYTFTVAELGEMLPASLECGCLGSLLEFCKEDDGSFIYCYDENTDVSFKGQKEANARAKLLIWLIENKHVDVEELNNV